MGIMPNLAAIMIVPRVYAMTFPVLYDKMAIV